MRSSSLRRIENMQCLIGALAEHSMGYREVAVLLGISDSAARNYLRDLELAGVADPDAGRRTKLRQHPDPAVLEGFLSAQAQSSDQQKVSLRRSTARHCTNPGKEFLHVLADDVRFPLVRHRHRAWRDPLVAALFGGSKGSHG